MTPTIGCQLINIFDTAWLFIGTIVSVAERFEGGGFNCRHKWEIAAEGGSDFHESTEAKELANA